MTLSPKLGVVEINSMAFQTPIAKTDVYKGSFFPQTIRDWNALPDSLISSAEDVDDCVTNIKSEMRSFKSNENIHKKEGGSYYVVSANKASSVTL